MMLQMKHFIFINKRQQFHFVNVIHAVKNVNKFSVQVIDKIFLMVQVNIIDIIPNHELHMAANSD